MANRWIALSLGLGVLFLIWRSFGPYEPPGQLPAHKPAPSATSMAPADIKELDQPGALGAEPARESIATAADTAQAEESVASIAAVAVEKDSFNARLMRLGEGVPGAEVLLTRSRETGDR